MILERIFESKYRSVEKRIAFERDDIIKYARELDVKLPKNLGDLIYSFRYRADLPRSIQIRAAEGSEWIIRGVGSAKYEFVQISNVRLAPNPNLAESKIPDSTPGVVTRYALSDEQALLARVRYNRLIDIFLGIVCYSLQNHLRTTVSSIGQVETDELYVGVDKRGMHYVIPVQAKAGKDRLSIVQIEQDLALCRRKFPLLNCRPVAAQFMPDDVIALFEFEEADGRLAVLSEKHYRLVEPSAITESDLDGYRKRID